MCLTFPINGTSVLTNYVIIRAGKESEFRIVSCKLNSKIPCTLLEVYWFWVLIYICIIYLTTPQHYQSVRMSVLVFWFSNTSSQLPQRVTSKWRPVPRHLSTHQHTSPVVRSLPLLHLPTFTIIQSLKCLWTHSVFKQSGVSLKNKATVIRLVSCGDCPRSL